MYRIFISYRRSDSESFSGRLRDRLRTEFGKRAVFMDTSTIPGGAKFDEAITQNLKTCKVFIAVIGKSWLDSRNDAGQRRLDDAGYWVRQEVAQALARDDLLVIPVIFGGAAMPGGDALPAGLQSLARRNAVSIDDADFDSDVARLIEACEPHVPRPRRWPWMAGAAAALLAVVGAWFWQGDDHVLRGVYLVPDRVINSSLSVVENSTGRKKHHLALTVDGETWETPDYWRNSVFVVSDSGLDAPIGQQDIQTLQAEIGRLFKTQGAADYERVAESLVLRPIKVSKLKVRPGARIKASLEEVVTDQGQVKRTAVANCEFTVPTAPELSIALFFLSPASNECVAVS